MKYFKKCITQNYSNFKGRARRKEFWHYVLWYNIIAFAFAFIIGFIMGLASVPIDVSDAIYKSASRLYAFVTLLPSLAVHIRRLHDVNKSGWFLLLALIPIVGWIILIVWFCTEGTKGDNKYGPDPKSFAPQEL